jgi:starch phosphorylase
MEAINGIAAGVFSPDDPSRFSSLVAAILGADEFMVAADFEAYWQAQRSIDARWLDPPSWWRASVLNTARMSWFSSDRIGAFRRNGNRPFGSTVTPQRLPSALR